MYSKFFTRLFLLIGMMKFLSVSAFAQGESIEIGQGTSKTTLAPIYTPHDHSVSQQLYTAEEIGTDGTITSIAFHWAYNGPKTYGIDVYMKHTERTYFETTNDRIPLSSSDKVFTGNINPNGDGWVSITLDTPFDYDGSNSLVIAVDRNSGSPGFSEFDSNWNVISTWYYTYTDRYTMLYIGNSSNIDPFNPPYMTPSNNRPNIQIEISSSTTTCKAPKNFAANNVTNNSATLTWTAGSEDQTNWEVYVTTNATVVPDENTTPTYQVTTCSKALDNLTAQTTYYTYVRANCGDGDKSKWTKKVFTTTREACHVGAENPYKQDFEANNDWGFTNGDLTNQWCWGSATNNGGEKAMYVSKDEGTTYEYAHGNTTIFASKLFNFSQGTYRFVFDWKANGESNYDYLRVALVPGDEEFTASTSAPSVHNGYFYNNLPTGWIALDGGSKLNLKSSWQTNTAEVSVSGVYTMVFVWRNDYSGGSQPPAAIDNISISMPNVHTKSITKYTEGTKDHYYLIASPIGEVNPENVGSMLENTYDLYYFDQANELEWINYKAGQNSSNSGFNLEPGKGYLYANSDDVKLTFIGTPYSGDGKVTLAYDQEASFPGWNLVGNPFAETAYIDRPFYVMNSDGSEIIAADAEQNSIAPMEGVFVRASEDGETMTFSTNKVVQQSQQIVVDVTRNRGITIDRAIVRFGEGPMLPKFQIRNDSPKVYIPMDGHDYAVVRSESMGELPLNFKATENGTYSISVNASDIETNYLHLIDNMTGADINLLENPSYSFEAKTSDYASRFKLVFATLDSPTNGNNFAFIDVNGNIVVNGEGTLQVVDVTGRVILSGNAMNRVSTAGMTAGVYVLRLINGNDVKTQRIVVR